MFFVVRCRGNVLKWCNVGLDFVLDGRWSLQQLMFVNACAPVNTCESHVRSCYASGILRIGWLLVNTVQIVKYESCSSLTFTN